jgi:hypothetical protein
MYIKYVTLTCLENTHKLNFYQGILNPSHFAHIPRSQDQVADHIANEILDYHLLH